jgi:histidinol-phosphate aminotransferase
LIIEAFFRNAKGKRVIARPSFALFESHTKMLGIPYETWELDQNLNFDLARFPDLPSGSVFMFASPNNPTGTVLPRRDLEKLLRQYPEALFIADEAYVEFSDEPYSELLQHYNNLIIIRTMSKTTGAAGVRLGYVIGPAAFISQVTKLRLPYLLNHFNVAASLVMLEDPEMQQFIKRNVTNAKAERERIYGALQKAFAGKNVTIYPSGANFLLIRCGSVDACKNLYKSYLEQGVLVRDVGGQPGLAGCLRLTIGLPAENDQLVKASAQWSP